MQIKHIVQTASGTYELNGEIEQEEFDYIFSLGLNVLLQQGAIATSGMEEEEDFEEEDPQYKMDLN